MRNLPPFFRLVATPALLAALGWHLIGPALAEDATKGLAPLPEVTVPEDNPMTPEKIDLGRMLYFDTRLSGDSSLSCSKCHDPLNGFTEESELSTAYPGTLHWRSTPTVLNAAHAQNLFWDGRAKTLEEQALGPIQAPVEMNQNLAHLEAKLNQIPEYVKRFQEVFGRKPNREDLAKAIATFERTIVSTNVPLDNYLKGDKDALSESQVRGMALFTGKAKCVSCHDGALLSDNDFHVTGVPETESLKKDSMRVAMRQFFARDCGFENYEECDEDWGLYFHTKEAADKWAFKTPSLREIELTAPYMHNGAFRTLEDVIEFYDRGGGDIPSKDPLLKPLNLTDREKKDLVDFLRALTGDPVEVEEPDLTVVTKGDGTF
jgi:cytochrome c peroxidase